MGTYVVVGAAAKKKELALGSLQQYLDHGDAAEGLIAVRLSAASRPRCRRPIKRSLCVTSTG